MQSTDVTIVGAGISGLHTAYELAKLGVAVKVLEASNRVGGRILSVSPPDQSSLSFDLGPSWFWPGQDNIESLVVELGLEDSVFPQYANGDALYEPIQQSVRRGVQGISMQGSYRMKGGLSTITNSLQDKICCLLGADTIQRNSKVNEIVRHDARDLLIQYGDGQSLLSKQVVIAVPPRVALEGISFSPELPISRVAELESVATWMAGQAKAVMVYDNPFWRDSGFSGDVYSERGPLSEIHDASFPNSEKFALFGFLAAAPKYRETNREKIFDQIVAQLRRLFGDQASEHAQLFYKDWAADPLVATLRDQLIANHHPLNSLSSIVEEDWKSQLVWSGTETAHGRFNGYIEGALVSSKAAIAQIRRGFLSQSHA